MTKRRHRNTRDQIDDESLERFFQTPILSPWGRDSLVRLRRTMLQSDPDVMLHASADLLKEGVPSELFIQSPLQASMGMRASDVERIYRDVAEGHERATGPVRLAPELGRNVRSRSRDSISLPEKTVAFAEQSLVSTLPFQDSLRANEILEQRHQEKQDARGSLVSLLGKKALTDKAVMAASVDMEEALFNPGYSPRVRAAAARLERELARLPQQEVLSQAQVAEIMRKIGL